MEQFAESAHNAYVSGELPESELESFAKMFAGYVGLLIQFHKGGEWVEETPVANAGAAIKQSDGTYHFVAAKAYGRIKNGSEDNLLHFYQRISYS